jgi:hypothetical protein
MNLSLPYKISSALLLLFSILHTYGMFKPPAQGAARELVSSVMRTVHFSVMEARRSFWDLYFGFGLLFTVFLLFSAVVAWQFSMLDRKTLHLVRMAAWGFAASHAGVAVLCVLYFFLAPAILSAVIALCLTAAAAGSTREG